MYHVITVAELSRPVPGYSSRGDKNQKRGPHLKNTVLDVCRNQGAKRELGRHRFQMGDRAPLPPPAGDGPVLV